MPMFTDADGDRLTAETLHLQAANAALRADNTRLLTLVATLEARIAVLEAAPAGPGRRIEAGLLEQHDFSLHILDSLGEGLVIMELFYTRADPALAALLGYTPDELIGKQPADITDPDEQSLLVKEWVRAWATGEGLTTQYDYRLKRKDGTFIQRHGDLYADGLIDAEWRYTYVNPAFAAMLGYPVDAMIGRRPEDIMYVDDLPLFNTAATRRWQGEKSYEMRLVRRDGSLLPVLITAVPHPLHEQFASLVAVITDLRARKQLEEALLELSLHDALTGLLNRRAFNTILAEEAALHDRYARPVSLALIDVDHFKQVNDTYGHTVGDGVLQWIARCISASVRAEDRVARFGGEEIAVVLPETAEVAACEVADRLHAAVGTADCAAATADCAEALPTAITVSVGVATMHDGESLENFLARADRALYEAKRAGRNRVRVAL